MNAPLAVFRCDASPVIGGGHVVRCVALAEALVAAGWQCLFATGPETTASMLSVLRHRHIVVCGVEREEASAIATVVDGRCDLLVIDHYDRDALFETACRGWAGRTLVIDDLADRSHDCDMLLDQTPERTAADYSKLVPTTCRLLLGPRYALLRPQFAARRSEAIRRRANSQRARRILMSFGSTDLHGLAPRILAELLARDTSLEFDVTAGPIACPDLHRLVTESNGRITLHLAVQDMAALMVTADLAIGAAGTSSWERCALGLPAAMVIVADNQRVIAERLVNAGAAILLGHHRSFNASAAAQLIIELASDPDHLARLSDSASRLCDGRGIDRVRLALAGDEDDASGAPVTLRLAEPSDREIIFTWQTRPHARRYARIPSPPSLDEHCRWFNAVLADPCRLLCVIEVEGKSRGVLRLDPVPDDQAFELSILVDAPAQCRGVASAALRIARRLVPGIALEAEVHPDNAASHALFAKAGYRPGTLGKYRSMPQ